jgi:peptide chain release factor 1
MIDRRHIDSLLAKLPEIEGKLSDPAVTSQPKKLRDLVREHARLKKLAEKADRYASLLADRTEHRELIDNPAADADLRELAKAEIDEVENSLAAIETEIMALLLPPDPSEHRHAIMEIRAGTGGDEAALFAADLFRMYSHFAEGKGWKIGMIDASTNDLRGYKSVIFSVEGPGAYGVLRYESGGHRVQRIPVTEAAGRIHTSAATVAVFPEAEEEDDIEIAPQDIRVDIFCSGGPGGQGVNTTYSAVRLTHLPTGLVAQSQDERSQHRNKDKAMAVLKARLLDARRREEEQKMGTTRRTLIGSGDRSERIRTYNFPQNRLTDHRINLTLYSLNRLIEGDLDPVVSALREQDVKARLEEETAALKAAEKA